MNERMFTLLWPCGPHKPRCLETFMRSPETRDTLPSSHMESHSNAVTQQFGTESVERLSILQYCYFSIQTTKRRGFIHKSKKCKLTRFQPTFVDYTWTWELRYREICIVEQ
jgi:hypothetical protein